MKEMRELVLCEMCEEEFDSLELFNEHWKNEHLELYGYFLCHPWVFYYVNEREVRARINRVKKKNHIPIENGWCTECDEPFRWNEETQSLYCKCSQSSAPKVKKQ